MYLPQAFAETRVEVLHALVRAQPLGTLVTSGPDGLDANHVPFVIDPEPAPFGTLRAHVARGNAAWRDLDASPRSLVIFQGEQAYVSPSWYPGKRTHGKEVPTWNYVVVHAHGDARVIHDAAWLHALVTTLTETHERLRAEPWAVSDAPPEYIRQQLRGIVGIEIPIARLEGKWKASQNRAPADQAGVAAGLAAEGSAFAPHMRRT